MSIKKLVSAALVASTMLSMVGVSALPLANAQTTADLQAQIAALLAQITALQAQLGAGASASASYNFTRDLTVGSKGADVTALQQLLISKGFLAIAAPTGYFGALTQAALGKFQAANGISPTAGYFGPKTRAFVNAMSTGGGTTGGGSTGGGTTAPATGLAVSVASDNPATGSLVSGAARIPVLSVNFTAGNSGAVTLSEVKFHKTGVLSDSSISGAYLVQGGKVVAQYNSINQGVIDFSGLNLQVSAGQTQELTLAIDTTGSNNGNTTGFALTSASDVSAWDTANTAVTPSGSFPINGNIFTLTSVSNPSLAGLTITSSSIGTQVTAGTQGNLVGAWNFSVTNNKVWLKGLNFRVIGSANKGDIRNVKLMVNGTQVGATLATVGQDGTAYFDASANPGVLNTGSNNVQVFADVLGSPSYNFQFEVLNSYDVLAVDSQYNVPISVTNTGGTGTQVSIQQGQITVTQDANTPTGSIAKGQSQVTLAKFDVYAAGEAVRVKFLGFQLVFAGATTTLSNMVRNIALTDDAGGQVGSTINTPPSSNTCDFGTAGFSGATYTDCFGTSGSPINYIVPANTTRVISLKADIQSIAGFGSVTASLTGNTNNLQGLTSSQVSGSGSAQGSAMGLSNSSLTVTANNALGNQNISAGVTNQKVGSYSFSAASAEAVNVSNVQVKANGPYFQNLKAFVNGSQFGTTQGTVSSGTTYTFSGTPFNVPAGSTVNVDIYADTLSSATSSINPATILTGLSASGASSFTAISLSASVNGQNLSFAGNPAVTVSTDSTQPPAAQVTMGSSGNTLAVFRFTETSNVENVKVTDLNVVDSVTATATVKAAFSNLQLFNGSTLLGTAGSAVGSASGTAYIYTFHFNTPIIVPQANSVSITLKGDAASYASQGASDNSVHTFKVATTTDNGVNSTVTNNSTSTVAIALGLTSNKSAAVTLSSASGNAQTVLRSTLTVSAAALGTSAHSKASTDDIGTVTFSANSAGPVAITSTTVTLGGSGATSTVAAMQLVDSNGLDVVVAGEATSSVSGNAKTWGFIPGFQISAGGSYTFKVRVNSTAIGSQSGVSQSLTANIQNTGDVVYTDGLDASSTAGLVLPTSMVPIVINSVTYPQGQ